MRKRALFLAALFISTGLFCFAQDLEPAKTVFLEYIESMNHGDFADATAHIYKKDLDVFREMLLPIMIQLSGSENPENSKNALAILKTDSSRWNQLTSQEFFANFLAFSMGQQEGLIELLAQCEITISGANYIPEKSEAVIEYIMLLNGTEFPGSETLIYDEGAWFIKLKQDPAMLKEVFESMLNE